MLLRRLWFIAWCILIVLCLVALVDVSKITCDTHIPILLSRALTTDPYRGLILVFCLGGVGASFFFNSTLLFVAILGFLSAFIVSMFDTNAHDALILLSSALVLYECWPQQKWKWKLHYGITVVSGIVCASWMLYSIFGCKPVKFNCQQPYGNDPEPGCIVPIPESIRCERCSWFYISEYLFFWGLFLLVYWKIPEDAEFHDHIEQSTSAKYKKLTIQEHTTGQQLTF